MNELGLGLDFSFVDSFLSWHDFIHSCPIPDHDERNILKQIGFKENAIIEWNVLKGIKKENIMKYLESWYYLKMPLSQSKNIRPSESVQLFRLFASTSNLSYSTKEERTILTKWYHKLKMILFENILFQCQKKEEGEEERTLSEIAHSNHLIHELVCHLYGLLLVVGSPNPYEYDPIFFLRYWLHESSNYEDLLCLKPMQNYKNILMFDRLCRLGLDPCFVLRQYVLNNASETLGYSVLDCYNEVRSLLDTIFMDYENLETMDLTDLVDFFSIDFLLSCIDEEEEDDDEDDDDLLFSPYDIKYKIQNSLAYLRGRLLVEETLIDDTI
jgi:hypothetical protein